MALVALRLRHASAPATGWCQWSGDNRYLATRNDNMPTTVWVWDMTRMVRKTAFWGTELFEAVGTGAASEHLPVSLRMLTVANRVQELAAVLMQKDPVKALDWDPVHCRLALCTGTAKIFMWAPEGASCVHVPLPGFLAASVRWNPTGTAFVLSDRDTFCCAFLGAP